MPSALAMNLFFLLALLGGLQRGSAPASTTTAAVGRDPAEIILAFAEDPHRSLTAARLQRRRPGSQLYIQGDRHLLELSRRRLKAAGLWPEPPPHLLELSGTCDTVAQLTEFVPLLDRFPRPGRWTVVTSREHLDRSLAIARILTSMRGWQVEGSPVDEGFVAPQHPFGTPRDALRALLWRVTGWHGRLAPCRQKEIDS